MAWIAVHEEVLGTKLRGFRKKLNISDVTALGILTYMWLWARKNTDATGFLANTDRNDIADAIVPGLGNDLEPLTVVDAIIECGWIDDIDGNLYIHDWYEWQKQWYSYLERKEKDRARKAEGRKGSEEKQPPDTPEPPDEIPSQQTPPEEKSDKQAKSSKNEVPKRKYADHVSMTENEHSKLVDKFGSLFTSACIDKLSNYKGQNGKHYKSDYSAILNWVVDEIKNKNPGLLERSKRESRNRTTDQNPFEEWGDSR